MTEESSPAPPPLEDTDVSVVRTATGDMKVHKKRTSIFLVKLPDSVGELPFERRAIEQTSTQQNECRFRFPGNDKYLCFRTTLLRNERDIFHMTRGSKDALPIIRGNRTLRFGLIITATEVLGEPLDLLVEVLVDNCIVATGKFLLVKQSFPASSAAAASKKRALPMEEEKNPEEEKRASKKRAFPVEEEKSPEEEKRAKLDLTTTILSRKPATAEAAMQILGDLETKFEDFVNAQLSKMVIRSKTAGEVETIKHFLLRIGFTGFEYAEYATPDLLTREGMTELQVKRFLDVLVRLKKKMVYLFASLLFFFSSKGQGKEKWIF